MKKFLLVLPLISSMSFASECLSLSTDQLHVLQQSYDYGQKYDYGLTLATIAMKESSAGLYTINAVSQDFGVYQGNYKTLCNQVGIEPNSFACNMEVSKVVHDIDVAASHALTTLLWWSEYYQNKEGKVTYERVIRSYNAGFNPDSTAASNYWNEFKSNMNMIKKCVKL